MGIKHKLTYVMQKPQGLLGTGRRGGGYGGGGGEREIIYLSLHCRIMVGSDESHLNVS